MSNENHYFDKVSLYFPLDSLIESNRVIDIRDDKWAHPALKAGWDVSEYAGPFAALWSNAISTEEKKARAIELSNNAIQVTNGSADPDSRPCDITSYTVPGCPEEPDVSTEVRVFRPKTLKMKKARVLFYSIAGALVVREPEMFPIEEFCVRYNCVAVTVMFRRSWEAQYPAAINDLHAGYKWMIENAEMLQINPDNVVLTGLSSGAHLSLALGFRLKRYGYRPKGIVAVGPQTDDRETNGNSQFIYTANWDGVAQHGAMAQWMGPNFASSRIGPEALANHATVEECVGYPPTFIHTVEFDPDRDYHREFYGKLLQAQSYAEYHCWGGAHHSSNLWDGAARGNDLNEYSERFKVILDGNIEDCFKYDLRRPWVEEEHKGK